MNLRYPENADAGTVAPAGSLVLAAGARGAQGEKGEEAKPGDWQPFVVDLPWTHSLRLRLLNGGLNAQFDGIAPGALPAGQQVRLGSLPQEYCPQAAKLFAIAVRSGAIGSSAELFITPLGDAYLTAQSALDTIAIDAIWPLD